MKLILATWNKTKLNWLTEGLSPLKLKIQPVNQNEIEDVEETGSTCTENALIKVRAVGATPYSIIIGEDSILSIDALDGFPGVKTVRWSPGTDDDRSIKILGMLKDIPKEKRGAKFQSAIAVLFPDGTEKTFIGTLNGSISEQLLGKEGKGYQRIFKTADGKVLAESGSNLIRKNDHRDQAIQKVSQEILAWIKKNNER